MSAHTKETIDKLIADPHRPRYHFAGPAVDCGPGDPNGAFFAEGRYHLMYLYHNKATNAYHWGHLSSADLLHWQSHPDALTQENGDGGCYSGGAFLDDDLTAYIPFWKFKAPDGSDNGGIAIAYSKPPYDKWERIHPLAINGSAEQWGIVDLEVDGNVEHLGCSDPSNIWKENGYYYMQTGNLVVLNVYGRAPDSEEKYKGDWTDLFRSSDMKHWEFVHRFYKNEHSDEDWPDETEDDMCPSFLPLPDEKSGGKLTDTYLQLFISHNKGTQYYLGKLKNETFSPEKHGRMSWKNRGFFAPEALIDDKNRQLAWFWMFDEKNSTHFEQYGWSGVYTFPRVLWLENNELKMAPAEELDQLQTKPQQFAFGTVDGKEEFYLNNPKSFRIKAKISMKDADYAGFIVRAGDSDEGTKIIYSKSEQKLIFESMSDGEPMVEQAPFILTSDEMLTLDIFVDHSMFEVYANERQGTARQVYLSDPETAIKAFAISDGAEFTEVTAYEMMPANLF